MAKGILDLESLLNEYSEEIQEAITVEAERIAKAGANELKATSPKSKKNSLHRGKYAKGWRVKTTKGKGFVNCIIHNATDYQLTHLLEKKHLTHNGGLYVPKKKHIEPVNNKCVEQYQKTVEQIIKNGG